MYIDEKLLKFILKYHGNYIDFDGRYGNQCMDLYRQYVKEVLAFPQSVGVPCAKDVWYNYPQQYYTRVDNGPNNYPLPGDIVIWGNQYGECGHIAICLYADGMRMVNFSQNDPLHSACHVQHYSYYAVLGWLHPRAIINSEYATLPEGHALRGVHGPADPGDWAWDEHNALDVIRECGFLAVKTLCPGASAPQVSMMRSKGARFICVRLFAKLNERRGDTLQQRAEWFYNEVAQAALELYGAGVRYFEIANEPNLLDEGLGHNWDNGVEFAQFFGYVVNLLRVSMPQIKCGFPGLSPGGTIPGVRQDSSAFWQQAQQAVAQADYLNCHAYWGGDGSTWGTALAQVIAFCKANPSKVVILSEFSDNGPADKAIKGQEYRAFYAALETQTPPNLGAATVFVLKASAGFEHETLIERDGTRSAIVTALS